MRLNHHNISPVFFKDTRDKKMMNFIFFLMCVSVICGSFFISTDGHGCDANLFGLRFPLKGICLFKFFTGYNCPVCGMTRCFSYISHGDFLNAVHIAPAGVFVYILCVFESIYRLLRIFFGDLVRKKPVRIIEAVIITAACFAVVFFFIAQFFDNRLIN